MINIDTNLKAKLKAGICPSCDSKGLRCNNKPEQLVWKCEQCNTEKVEPFNMCETCGDIDGTVSNSHPYDTAEYMCEHCADWHKQDEYDNIMRD